ncbi:MAG: efflux RND transporter periplasmic adaptor subunit [Myxococcales bacterium]|nr:efflux RND transporter periplasmic adaptor subunit [Myxococcales bacterium]
MKTTTALWWLVPLSALAAGEVKEPPKAGELAERKVKVAPVETGEVVEAVSLTGELQGMREVRVMALLPERIRSLPVQEGQKVKQGDILCVLWGDLQTQGVDQAQAGLEAAISARDAARDSLARMRALSQAGSIPKSQLEAIEAQSRTAEAQVRQATAAVGAASAQKQRTVIRSPIDGVATQIALREGDLASPGVPIMTVVNPRHLKAVLRVPERHFLKLVEGLPVELSPLARPDQKVEAKVSLKSQVIDRMTRTGMVEVHLDNPDGALVAGSAVRAKVVLNRRPGVVLVPAEAVLLTPQTDRTGEAVAFVADGTKALRREVKVGARQGGWLEIVSGLRPGESLVVHGAHFLRDGNPIQVVAAAGAKP